MYPYNYFDSNFAKMSKILCYFTVLAYNFVHSHWYIVQCIVVCCSLRTRPPPKARKKPPPAPKPNLPMCKAIYDYEATDTDELTFRDGEVIEIIKEGSLPGEGAFALIAFMIDDS